MIPKYINLSPFIAASCIVKQGKLEQMYFLGAKYSLKIKIWPSNVFGTYVHIRHITFRLNNCFPIYRMFFIQNFVFPPMYCNPSACRRPTHSRHSHSQCTATPIGWPFSERPRADQCWRGRENNKTLFNLHM